MSNSTPSYLLWWNACIMYLQYCRSCYHVIQHIPPPQTRWRWVTHLLCLEVVFSSWTWRRDRKIHETSYYFIVSSQWLNRPVYVYFIYLIILGFFCTSLFFIDNQATLTPAHAFFFYHKSTLVYPFFLIISAHRLQHILFFFFWTTSIHKLQHILLFWPWTHINFSISFLFDD